MSFGKFLIYAEHDLEEMQRLPLLKQDMALWTERKRTAQEIRELLGQETVKLLDERASLLFPKQGETMTLEAFDLVVRVAFKRLSRHATVEEILCGPGHAEPPARPRTRKPSTSPFMRGMDN